MNNKDFSKQDKVFRECCEKEGIPTTRRQASKFRNKRGRAFKHKYSVTKGE